MKTVDFKERLERIDSQLKPKVETMLNYLYENSSDFEEMNQILTTVEKVVREQMKKVDTNKFK